MPRATIRVRRVLGTGRADLFPDFPPGWRIEHVPAIPPVPPPRRLPAPRSVPVPEGRLLVVVNDAQRATPTPWLMGLLDCDWSSPELRIAVATGCHAPPTEPEMREIFGGLLETVRARVHVHRAAADPLLRLGTTSRGTPVEVSGLLDWPDAVVCLGSVEPHYFAGWTGGRKSLVPGLCSLETMRANHRLACGSGPAPGALSTNPLHLDLEEAAGLIRARLLGRGAAAPLGLNALAVRGQVHAWHAGPLQGTVDALAPQGRELFGRRLREQAGFVVCFVDHPLDRDLYQALKGFEHWKSAVAPGGILALVADCPAGIGPTPFTQFLGSPPTLAALESRIGESYRLGDHKLLNFLRFTASGRQLWLVSQQLAGQHGLPLPTFDSVSAAIRAAEERLTLRLRRSLLIEDGATLFPVPRPSP